MRNANQCGYGATGNPNHPYHSEFGPDTYYPAKPEDNELRAAYYKAQEGLQQVHAFMAARAMAGDLNAMAAWDAMMKTLAGHGYPGLSCGRSVPWNECAFNPDRVSRVA